MRSKIPLHRRIKYIIKRETNPYTRTFWRRERPRYAITQEICGVPVRYLQWDNEKVWRWTNSPNKCCFFDSPQTARYEAESCSMSWREAYTIRRLP